MTVHHLNQLLLVCSVVLLVAVVAVRISSRSGLPSLLVYLGIGVLMGQDGIGGIHFNSAAVTQVMGYAALVVILAEGGLGTKWKEIRPVLPSASVLATAGVAVSVGVTAAAAHYLVGLEWRQALIIGAVVSSTDAAAVFSVLRRVPLPARVTGTLEAESGFNDAPVVILVVAFSTAGPVEHWYALLGKIALELAVGAAIGLAVGWLGSLGLKRVALPASGLYPIAVMAIAVAAYAAGALAHGSGFLAVYLASMTLGNAKLPHWPATRGFAEGLGWIAQIGMFVVLGLLVTPHELGDDIWPALVIGLALTMVARPLSVVLSLAPFRVPWQEQTLMSWAGLRGAVPIILATIPMVNGVVGSRRIFNIVFVLVVVYTLIQGPTLPWLARRLRLGEQGEASDLGIESAPLERLRGHLLSVSVPEGSRMHGVEVNELRLPPGAAVTLVVREGKSFVPLPTTVLRRGDELLVVATDPVRDATERRLRAVAHGGKLASWLGTDGPSSSG
ncbi:K+/H+ antiporter [Streptomyces pluripotens]|uniref:K+/H+ antiporter n=1 Tax=Streptomyces pluripotens TaxID=1355015 RepID=A0A221P1M5_9ACTN|nr:MULTISPECIES: potassium/proton antiporter [Streptomyces]ARP71734.1 K+/H+ antiporter [Streptomyces pluripotens]ASN25986.1 K+/H+ antiporter [Streptomyces pluripotens]MCH0556231.1 potassium/proton antiporter [Streptomyces sp. MUM 16J]